MARDIAPACRGGANVPINGRDRHLRVIRNAARAAERPPAGKIPARRDRPRRNHGGCMSKRTHVNLSGYGSDPAHLYEIWDADMKKCIARRRVAEVLGIAWVAATLLGFAHPSIEAFVATLIGIFYMAIIQFVDESNVNYLMHGWDLREALDSMRKQS
jgi:hypothetical protein